MSRAFVPAYCRAHGVLAEDFAHRHFTDPDVTIADAAAFTGVDPRTLTRSLGRCGTSWHEIVHELRLAQAQELLSTKTYPIDQVARLSGYSSRSAFARAFRTRFGATPSEYRRGKKGPARAGGVTGAFARKRKRPYRPGMEEGSSAVQRQAIAEARQRLADRRALERFERIGVGFSVAEIAAEMTCPRRLREDPAYWRKRRRLFERWRVENPADDERIAAEAASAEARAALARELLELLDG